MSSLSLLVIVLAGCTLTTTTGMVTPSGGKSLPTTRRQPFVQQQQQQQYGPATTSGTPNAIGTDLKHTVTRNAAVFSAAALAVSSGSSISQPAVAVADSLTLPKNAYTTLGKDGMPMCRILNGMWQLSGGHGFEPQFNKALAEMNHCADTGFTTFDLADHYGPAEDYVGQFSKGKYASSKAKNCQFFTKWVPMPVEMTRRKVEDAVDVSLKRMETDRLDLMQFHWWQYSNPNYFDALGHLTDLKEKGKIRNIGLTNFDTERLAGIPPPPPLPVNRFYQHTLALLTLPRYTTFYFTHTFISSITYQHIPISPWTVDTTGIIDQNIPIVSNQIAFSLIDTRPLKKMSSYCKEKNIKLLCYGTLMGGFVSKEWLNQPMPARESLNNMSLRKYLPWIMYWGK